MSTNSSKCTWCFLVCQNLHMKDKFLFRLHVKEEKSQTRVLLTNILLLSTQMRIIAVHQSLVPASPCSQWMFPSRGVFIVVVLVIKIYALFSDVHPLYHLARGSKSQQIKWWEFGKAIGVLYCPSSLIEINNKNQHYK